MKNFFLTTVLCIITPVAFCQNNYIKTRSIGQAKPELTEKKEDKFPYGPVKFRELEETIGETYLILPLDKSTASLGYFFIYKGLEANSDFHLSAIEGGGKLLILKAINNEIANFKDSLGNDYSAKINNNYINNMIAVYDIDQARKLFLNKTLWMNKDFLKIYDDRTDTYQQIKNVRFEPVKVIEIAAGNDSAWPVRFVLQTAQGETGYADAVVSGTNANIKYLLKYMFESIFYTKDPKLTYKFTPAMWAKIKTGETQVGMTTDQVRLSRGRPDKINNSSDPASADQWIYGNTYLYFRNGKLTTIQN